MKKMLTMLVLVFGLMPTVQAQQTLTVAQDGTGDYTTIQAAVDAAPADAETVIRIKAGTYAENVNIGTRQKASTQRLSFVGDGLENTIVTSAKGLSTSPKAKDIYATPAVAVYANDFYAQDITFQNTAGKSGGQALALFVSGDRQTYYRCRIAGYQDTHRSKKNTRSYYKDCIIEGATDYIYAGGTCWFEQCTILSKVNSYITAASTPKDVKYGYIFNRCKLIAAEGADKVFLGRPWRPYAYTLFIYTEMDSHIRPEGWENWRNPDNEKTARYMEYGSTGPGANAKARVAWAKQLTKKEAQQITLQAVMGDWNP